MMGFADHAACTSFARDIAYYSSVHGITRGIIRSSHVMVNCVSIAAFLLGDLVPHFELMNISVAFE